MKLLKYPRLPEDFVCITTYFDDEEAYYKQFKTHHYAMDMAYTSKWTGGKKYVYAASDGVIKWRQNANASGSVANALRIEHYDLIEGKTVHTRYFHMESIADGMVVGKEVKRGEILGIEGKTGNATGSHLHFEFLICPTDYSFKSADVSKYAVDPLDYCYLYPEQQIGYDPKNEVLKLPEITETPLAKGSIFKCLKSNALYYRTSPKISNDNRVGLLPEGEYEALASFENGGYTWIKFLFENSEVAYWSAVYDELSTVIPPIDYEALWEEEKAKNAELQKKLVDATKEKEALVEAYAVEVERAKLYEDSLNEVKNAINVLKSL